jgi:hypothetical protein
VKWLTTLCLSFNYIIAPATGGLLSSSVCFADYFKEQPKVVSFYNYDICRAYSLDMESGTRRCTAMTTASFDTSFVPPFIYNYQCSSTLITTYVAVLMLEHAIITLVPIVLVFLFSHKSASAYVPNWFIRSAPSIVWPPQFRQDITGQTDFRGALLRPDRMIAAFMSHFAVLITYGLADPFLAVAICIAMVSLSLLGQTLIGRDMYHYRHRHDAEAAAKLASVKTEYTYFPSDKKDTADITTTPTTTTPTTPTTTPTTTIPTTTALPPPAMDPAAQPLADLNALCAGILEGLPSCLWTILAVGSLFMSAILADLAGDKVICMYYNGGGVLLVVLCWWLWCCCLVLLLVLLVLLLLPVLIYL